MLESLPTIAAEAASRLPSAKLAIQSIPYRCPDALDPQKPSTEVEKALTGLFALAHYLQQNSTRLTALTKLEKNWTTIIWPWISLLLHHFVLVGKPTTVQGIEVQEKLVWLVPYLVFFPYGHGNNSDVRTIRNRFVEFVCGATPNDKDGGFGTLVKLWIYSLDSERAHPALVLQSMALNQFLAFEGRQRSDLYSILPDLFESTPNAMTSMLNFISCWHREPNPIICTVHVALRILSICSVNYLSMQFISKGAVQIVTLALKHLSSDATDCIREANEMGNAATANQYLTCIKWALCYISDAIVRYGNQALILALECHLLSSMMNAAPFVVFEGARYHGYDTAKDSTTNIYAELLHMISPPLVYRDVLNLFMKSLRKMASRREAYSLFLTVIDRRVNSEILPLKASVVWRGLISRAARIKESRRVFKANDLVVCSNENLNRLFCTRDPPNEPLKRCPRCLITFYCSKKCQKQHWTDGRHKEECKALCGYLESDGLPVEVTEYDRSFFKHLIQQEVYTRIAEIRGPIQELLSNQNRNEEHTKVIDSYPIIFLDFRRIPTSLHIAFHDDLVANSKIDYPLREKDRAGEKEVLAQRMEQEVPIVYAVFPAGRNRLVGFIRDVDLDI